VVTGKVRSPVWRLPGSGVQNLLPSEDDTNMYSSAKFLYIIGFE